MLIPLLPNPDPLTLVDPPAGYPPASLVRPLPRGRRAGSDWCVIEAWPDRASVLLNFQRESDALASAAKLNRRAWKQAAINCRAPLNRYIVGRYLHSFGVSAIDTPVCLTTSARADAREARQACYHATIAGMEHATAHPTHRLADVLRLTEGHPPRYRDLYLNGWANGVARLAEGKTGAEYWVNIPGKDPARDGEYYR